MAVEIADVHPPWAAYVRKTMFHQKSSFIHLPLYPISPVIVNNSIRISSR